METTHSKYFTTWQPLVFLSFLCHPYYLLGNFYYFLVDLYRLPRTHYVLLTYSKNSLHLTIIRHPHTPCATQRSDLTTIYTHHPHLHFWYTFTLFFLFLSYHPHHYIDALSKYTLISCYHPSPTKHTLSIVSVDEGPHSQKVLSSLQLLFIHCLLASQLGVPFGILQYVYIKFCIILDMKNIH